MVARHWKLTLSLLIAGGAALLPRPLEAQVVGVDRCCVPMVATDTFVRWPLVQPAPASSSRGLVARAVLGGALGAVLGVVSIPSDARDAGDWGELAWVGAVGLGTAGLPMFAEEADGRRWWIGAGTLVGAGIGATIIRGDDSPTAFPIAWMLSVGGALVGIASSRQ